MRDVTDHRYQSVMRHFTSRRVQLLAIPAAVLVIAAILAARSPTVRDWLWQATGEEDLWQGVKGVVALAGLEMGGQSLDLAPDAPIEHLGVNLYGVNAFLQLEADPENVRRSLAMMRDAGIGWVRQEFPWEDIEIHGRGDFEDRRNDPPRSAWEKYDRIVRTAVGHNVGLIVRLDNPPDWAFADAAAAGEKGPPDDLEDLGNFVAAVAARYCGQVRYYQIWNEPNIYPEWGERDVDPVGYAQLLAVAAQRVRAACDDAVIVSAALAQTTEPGGRNMDDLKYLEALYEAGWAAHFDVLAVQAFGLWTGPTDHRVSHDRANFVRPLLARDIMVRHGDGGKAVWITEMGWDSPPPEMSAPYGRTTEDGRARYTVAAYERIAAEWPWVGVGCLWYFRRPDWEWHERPEGFFRIVEPDWIRTPTYDALADLANRRPIVIGRGQHRPDDWAITYAGPWRDEPSSGPLSYRVGAPDAEQQFAFRGTGFRIAVAALPTGPQSESVGEAVEEPAGEAAGGATGDASGHSADEAAPAELFLVVDQDSATVRPAETKAGFELGRDGLPDGVHVVIIRVDRGLLRLGEIVIDGPSPGSPLAPVYQAGWLVLFGSVVLAVLVLRRHLRSRRRAEPT